MPTLEQFLETQHQGVRQNPYFYKIVSVLDVYSKRDLDNLTIKQARDGILYKTIESIPKEYYNRLVYHVEPCIIENGALCLRIVTI